MVEGKFRRRTPADYRKVKGKKWVNATEYKEDTSATWVVRSHVHIFFTLLWKGKNDKRLTVIGQTVEDVKPFINERWLTDCQHVKWVQVNFLKLAYYSRFFSISLFPEEHLPNDKRDIPLPLSTVKAFHSSVLAHPTDSIGKTKGQKGNFTARERSSRFKCFFFFNIAKGT